jgi:hypothetical protein
MKGGSVGGKEALWAYDPRKGFLGNPLMGRWLAQGIIVPSKSINLYKLLKL